jgi:hypothetical protein
MNRQAATTKGLQRRIRDLGLQHVEDPRQGSKVRLSLPTVLTTLVAAMVTQARSLRSVEQRSAQIAAKHGNWMGLSARIADNTLGKIVPRVPLAGLAACLHRLVKAEHRRGNLEPTRLPHGTVAIDGKHVGTLRWHDVCRLLGLDEAEASCDDVRTRMTERYPQAQLCEPADGQPYALMRSHSVTLISSDAAVCIHQRPIAGDSNEIGSMAGLVQQLRQVYGRSALFEMVTTDAGNTSCAAAGCIVAAGWDYFAQIKAGHGALYDEAHRVLSRRGAARAHASCADKQNGLLVTYQLWRHDLGSDGWLDWRHARQLVRIRRTTEDLRTGKVTVGNRYYVTSRAPATLSAATALQLSRAHWRCEDETHWTLDTQLHEDQRRLAWSRHPDGLLVVSLLRSIALAVLAVARRLSRFGHSRETPSWAQVAEHFLLQLCGSILQTQAFDRV